MEWGLCARVWVSDLLRKTYVSYASDGFEILVERSADTTTHRAT